jgi:hypothetical protein
MSAATIRTMANELMRPGSANEPPNKLRMPFALAALYAVTTPIAALAYGISAWGVYGFANTVWHLPFAGCIAAAVVADLLSLAGALATYVLRDSRLRVRAYTWGVFFGMTALSLGAQESFASARTIGKNGEHVGVPARIASGAIVLALALSVHLLIVVRRNAPDATTRSVREHPPAEVPAAVAKPTFQYAKPIGPVPPPKPQTDGRRRSRQPQPTGRPGRTANPNRDKWARAVVEGGEDTADVARRAGVSPRAVQKWAETYRAQHAIPAIALTDGVFTQTEPQVNGYEFTPGAAMEEAN